MVKSERNKIDWNKLFENIKSILQIIGLILLLGAGLVLVVFRDKIFGDSSSINGLFSGDTVIQHDPVENDENKPDSEIESNTENNQGEYPNASDSISNLRDRLNSIAERYGLRKH